MSLSERIILIALSIILKSAVSSLDHDSEKIKDDRRIAIYLEGEFEGLAIHLLQK